MVSRVRLDESLFHSTMGEVSNAYADMIHLSAFHVQSSVVASTFMSCTEISLLGVIGHICMHRCQNIEKQVRSAKIKVSTVAIKLYIDIYGISNH